MNVWLLIRSRCRILEKQPPSGVTLCQEPQKFVHPPPLPGTSAKNTIWYTVSLRELRDFPEMPGPGV